MTKYIRLGSIVSISKGKKPQIADTPSKNSVRVLQIDDLRNDLNIKFTNENNGVLAYEDDVLIAWDGANAGTVGFGKTGFVGSTIAILRIKDREEFDSRFVGKFLQSKYSYLRKRATGATIPHLDRNTLLNLLIPKLQRSEQFHIAETLCMFDDLVCQRKQSIDLLDNYLKNVFLKMFFFNPDNINWKEVKLESLAINRKASMRSGPFGSSLLHGEFTDKGDVKVLGIDNVSNNKFEWKKNRFISLEKFEELKRYQVYPKDVLISIMATLGKTAVVPDDIPLCINSKHLAAISLNTDLANPYFIAFAFNNSPQIIRQLKTQTKGAIMEGLNLTIIKNIKINNPPLELQNKFGEIFNIVQQAKLEFEQSLIDLEALCNSISQKAFNGNFL